MLNVQQLKREKIIEKLLRFRRIVTTPSKARDPLFLLRDVALAKGNMPLGLF